MAIIQAGHWLRRIARPAFIVLYCLVTHLFYYPRASRSVLAVTVVVVAATASTVHREKYSFRFYYLVHNHKTFHLCYIDHFVMCRSAFIAVCRHCCYCCWRRSSPHHFRAAQLLFIATRRIEPKSQINSVSSAAFTCTGCLIAATIYSCVVQYKNRCLPMCLLTFSAAIADRQTTPAPCVPSNMTIIYGRLFSA